MQQNATWAHVNHVSNVPQLNAVMRDPVRAQRLIEADENEHERRFSEAASFLASSGKRIVCMTGASASGKTTTSKRIQLHMQQLGFDSIALSTDSFYHDAANVPLDPTTGSHDYEAFEALNLGVLSDRLRRLIAGEVFSLCAIFLYIVLLIRIFIRLFLCARTASSIMQAQTVPPIHGACQRMESFSLRAFMDCIQCWLMSWVEQMLVRACLFQRQLCSMSITNIKFPPLTYGTHLHSFAPFRQTSA